MANNKNEESSGAKPPEIGFYDGADAIKCNGPPLLSNS